MIPRYYSSYKILERSRLISEGKSPLSAMEDDLMKPFKTQDVLNDVTSEIEKIAPRNSEIEIEVKEDPKGIFSTHIILHTKAKTYFAKKEDSFLNKSLYKAIRAIKAQIKKKRVNHLHKQFSLKKAY